MIDSHGVAFLARMETVVRIDARHVLLKVLLHAQRVMFEIETPSDRNHLPSAFDALRFPRDMSYRTGA